MLICTAVHSKHSCLIVSPPVSGHSNQAFSRDRDGWERHKMINKEERKPVLREQHSSGFSHDAHKAR